MTREQTEAARLAAYEIGIIASILLKLGRGEPHTDIGPEVEWLAQQVDAAGDVISQAVG